MTDASSKPLRVLLCDDSGDFRETISFWMQCKGFQVTIAGDGEEAIQQAENNTFDIIFMDIHMPKVDGIEALTVIRKKHKDLPVILLTAYPDPETIEKAKTIGIAGYFPKSGPFEDLAAMIGVALRTHKNFRS